MPDMLPYRPASASNMTTSYRTLLDRLKWQQPQQGSYFSISSHSYGNDSYHPPASFICQYNRPTTVSSYEKGIDKENKQQLSNHYTMLTSSSPSQKESTSASKKRKADRVHGGKVAGHGIQVCTKEKILIKEDKGETTVSVVKPEVENQQSTDSNTAKEAQGESSKENSKALAPKQDYIHVRARRGQATDSHSLAERVRREKISKRMKFLQDLVPGCNKITGKASMLDVIINYVQSLQKQVEFLSMKLASATPSIEFNIEQFFSKEIDPVSSTTCPPVGMSCELVDLSYLPFNNFQQPVARGGLLTALDHPELSLRRTMSAPAAVPEAFMDSCYSVNGSSVTWDTSMRGFYDMMGAHQ